MKKAFIASSLILILLTSCTKTAFYSQVAVTTFNENIVDKTDFKYSSILNSNYYEEENKYSKYIRIDVPNTKSEIINDDIISWAKSELEQFKNQKIDENSFLKIDYEIYPLDENIINLKFVIDKNIDGLDKTTVKTGFYDMTNNSKIDINISTSEYKNELLKISEIASTAFTSENTVNKINPDINIEAALNPIANNYKNFTLNPETKNLVFYFDQEQLGDAYKDEVISVDIPLKYAVNTFTQASPDIYNIFAKEFDKDKKYLAITFDDGPHFKFTPKLLDGLKELNIPATFFLLGYRIPYSPELVVRMQDEGHEVANHTYNHLQLTKISRDAVMNEIDETNKAISDLTGETPTLLRPPYGLVDDRLENIASELGMSMIMWSVDPLDWKDQNADTVYNNIMNVVENGDIILLHDVYDSTVDAALKVIPALQEMGYEFLTITELMEKTELLEAGKQYFYSDFSKINEIDTIDTMVQP